MESGIFGAAQKLNVFERSSLYMGFPTVRNFYGVSPRDDLCTLTYLGLTGRFLVDSSSSFPSSSIAPLSADRSKVLRSLGLEICRARSAMVATTMGETSPERFVRTIKEGCLEQIIFSGEDSLRNAIREFVEHYHYERNHQGLDNRLILSSNPTPPKTGAIQTRRRLGGMLNYYYRETA
jgi:Integrase core domain